MKFLIDAMLGKLARFLRMFGYDTIYANDLEDFFKITPVPDQKLIDYAIKNERFIITKDFPLHKIFMERSIHLKGEGLYNYLKQLNKKLNLKFNFKIEKARCSICNSKLKEVKNREIIKDLVLKENFKHYNELYQCLNPQCKKIYWEGSHIEDIKKKMDRII
jgi:uncharacterized protein with PIN domain